jgi:hypothetical protein
MVIIIENYHFWLFQLQVLTSLLSQYVHFVCVFAMSKKKKRNKMSKKRQRKVNVSMKKNKVKKVNVSGNPKHSFDVNRSNVATKNSRSAATIRRLELYKNRPLCNCKGKLLSNEFQSKDLPNTRIQPDPRWFTNTRVVG